MIRRTRPSTILPVPSRIQAAIALALALVALAAVCPPAALAQAPENGADAVIENRGENEMVLIHTIGSSAAVWDAVKPSLELGFKVWTFELPGHGQTPTIPDLTIDAAAELLGEFLIDNKIVYPVVVGHGMGGMIAMRYCFSHPIAFKKLILIDAGPKQMADRRQKIDITEQLTTNYDEFIANYFLGTSPVDSIARGLADQALRTDRNSFTELLVSSFDFDVSADLPMQAVPMLVIGSAMLFPNIESAEVTRALQELGYGAARTISFKTMPHNGHFMMLENPDYLASVIAAFTLKN